ncbi:fasciculation and elongation protein zeta-2 [Trichomycterus rosablanca]|uniref:fasciculation and elongation protein zeta-2 n=1 Tax=Trichomycterus rosablanca TaxID=2290929 RepID=UPI002F352162
MAAPGSPDLTALKPSLQTSTGHKKQSEPEGLKLNVDGLTELLNSLSDPVNTGHNNGESASFTSVEDLITMFDQKLDACFGNLEAESELIAPVEQLTENTVLHSDEIWNSLIEHFGKIMPVDWNQSYTRTLHLPTLMTEDSPRVDSVNLDVSDDEELREQMDLHSIIVPCVNDEPFVTAEQVIEEIEEMMQDSPDTEAKQNPVQLKLTQKSINHSFEERVRNLSVAKLNELLEEVEAEIRHYSEDLVKHLALRDELEFEKEVKNSFISVLIDMQNRQKEHREFMKKKKREKNEAKAEHGRAGRLPTSHFSMESISTAIQNGFRQTFRNGGGDKQYLTTVIPYEKKEGPPAVEDLQVLTKILQAMRDDSDKVPSLLTDYILKVLCPF